MEKKLQRDEIITLLDNKKDSNFYFISPDFGAKALDNYRKRNNDNFIFTGIAEQVSIDMAYGISLALKYPIIYGMSPFISARCYEQYKVLFGQTTLPICILPVGVGLGYDHNTNSHYSLEDISLYSSVNGLKIYTPVDCARAKNIFNNWLKNPHQAVIRLERQPVNFDIKEIYELEEIESLGLLLRRSKNQLIISWGMLGTNLLENENLRDYSILLLEEINPTLTINRLRNFLKSYETVILTEESFLNTGVQSFVTGSLKIGTKFKHFYVPSSISEDRYHRDTLWERYNLNLHKII